MRRSFVRLSILGRAGLGCPLKVDARAAVLSLEYQSYVLFREVPTARRCFLFLEAVVGSRVLNSSLGTRRHQAH